ncbi:MAG: protein-arginine deiminase family protein [Armatimonadota bacterium]
MAATAILGGGAVYADDWDGYHRLDGEVHCVTAAKRQSWDLKWWENQP